MLPHDRSKEEYVWNIGNPLGYFNTTTPCDHNQQKTSTTQNQEKLLIPRHITNEGLGHPISKEPLPAVELAEDKGNVEWVAKESSYKYQLRSCDQLRK